MTTLLLIDDDIADRLAVKRALLSAAFECNVVECDEAKVGLANAGAGIDCVLLDYLLPGATALELVPMLRLKLGAATPIIVLTGHGDEQVAVEVMKAGADDYLSKDRLGGHQLARAVIRALALGKSRARVEQAEQRERLYNEKLSDLVAWAPRYYASRTIEMRARSAVTMARQLLGASMATIVLEDERALYAFAVDANDHITAIGRDAAPQLEHEHTYRMAVTGAHWECHLRVATSPLGESADVLLAQLGELVSVGIENARLAERSERAVRARDTVITVVSHDLRSPLSGINLGLQLLRDPSMADETPNVLDKMERSVAHMRRLIEDLLDVARIDNNEFAVQLATLSVGSMLTSAAQIVGPAANATQIKLVVADAANLAVQADADRVVQVISNLVGNAIRFTPKDGEIHLSARAASEGAVQFTVADNGPGIDAEHLPRVFDRFWRKDGRGLGLGLFIAKAIVDAHHGRIWVESHPGKGAQFHFTLPRA